MPRWRFDPGTAGLGAACLCCAAVAWYLAGWGIGAVCLSFALAIIAMSASRHPEHEDHTGPFARCSTPPRGMPVLREEPADDETIGDP